MKANFLPLEKGEGLEEIERFIPREKRRYTLRTTNSSSLGAGLNKFFDYDNRLF